MEEQIEGKNEEEPHWGMYERGVNVARWGRLMVDEEDNVRVNQNGDEDPLQNCRHEEELHDPCYAPESHGPIREYEGDTATFNQGSLPFANGEHRGTP